MRYRRILSPITTDKHYIPRTNTGVASGAIEVFKIAHANPRGTARTTVDDIEEGSVIRAVHLEFWLNGRGAANTTQFVLAIIKVPAGATAPTNSNLFNLQAYENKRNVLYTTQGVLSQTGAQSVPVLRQWLLIPKGKQRMALEDKLHVCLAVSGETINWCGIAIYKEYV